MESIKANGLLLGLVVILHGVALSALALWPQTPSTQDSPTITGELIAAAPSQSLQAPSSKHQAEEPVIPDSAVAKPVTPKPLIPKPVSLKPAPEPAAPKPQPVSRPKPALNKAIKPTPEVRPSTANTASSRPSGPITETTDTDSQGAPVTLPHTDTRNANNPPPTYPRISRRRGEEGTVILELLVLKNGKVDDVRIKESSGFPRLDKSAINAVERWKYHPATRNGQPIDYRYLQPVTFNLKG